MPTVVFPGIPVLGIALRYWDDPLRLITMIMLPVFCGLADHLLVVPACISQPSDRYASEKWSRFLVSAVYGPPFESAFQPGATSGQPPRHNQQH